MRLKENKSKINVGGTPSHRNSNAKFVIHQLPLEILNNREGPMQNSENCAHFSVSDGRVWPSHLHRNRQLSSAELDGQQRNLTHWPKELLLRAEQRGAHGGEPQYTPRGSSPAEGGGVTLIIHRVHFLARIRGPCPLAGPEQVDEPYTCEYVWRGGARSGPLLVVEGSLLNEVLEGRDGVAGAEEQDAEDGEVQGNQAQEAALLIRQPRAGELVHAQRQDVADHGRTPVQLLCLRGNAGGARLRAEARQAGEAPGASVGVQAAENTVLDG